MATHTEHYDSSFTLAQLQTTVSTDERDIRGQLQSLEAVKNSDDEDVTEAVYDKSKKTKLGNITLVKSGGISGLQAFKGTAFINKKVENVAVFR